MRFRLKHAEAAQGIIDECDRRGVPYPDFIADAPDLRIDLVFVWEAFFELSWDRSVGMTWGPIPSSSIRQYATDYQLTAEEAYEFGLNIRAMDAVWLEHHRPKGQNK